MSKKLTAKKTHPFRKLPDSELYTMPQGKYVKHRVAIGVALQESCTVVQQLIFKEQDKFRSLELDVGGSKIKPMTVDLTWDADTNVPWVVAQFRIPVSHELQSVEAQHQELSQYSTKVEKAAEGRLANLHPELVPLTTTLLSILPTNPDLAVRIAANLADRGYRCVQIRGQGGAKQAAKSGKASTGRVKVP